MSAGLADIVYYDTDPVRLYVDRYCPIIEDTPEEGTTPSQAPAETPTPERTIIPSPRSARVRPYVLAHVTLYGKQLSLPLVTDNEPSTRHDEDRQIEEEYTPARLGRLVAAHEEARQHSGGFTTASPELLMEVIRGLQGL